MKGSYETEVPMGFHTVKYNTTQPILISANDNPIGILQPGQGKAKVRRHGGKLSFDVVDEKIPYSLEIVTRQEEGENTDDLPPPQPDPAPNYLAQIRRQVQMSMGIIREEFADHKSIYEVVDNLDEFEEEREQKRKDTAKKAAEAEKKPAQGQNEEKQPNPPENTNNPPEAPPSGSTEKSEK